MVANMPSSIMTIHDLSIFISVAYQQQHQEAASSSWPDVHKQMGCQELSYWCPYESQRPGPEPLLHVLFLIQNMTCFGTPVKKRNNNRDWRCCPSRDTFMWHLLTRLPNQHPRFGFTPSLGRPWRSWAHFELSSSPASSCSSSGGGSTHDLDMKTSVKNVGGGHTQTMQYVFLQRLPWKVNLVNKLLHFSVIATFASKKAKVGDEVVTVEDSIRMCSLWRRSLKWMKVMVKLSNKRSFNVVSTLTWVKMSKSIRQASPKKSGWNWEAGKNGGSTPPHLETLFFSKTKQSLDAPR